MGRRRTTLVSGIPWPGAALNSDHFKFSNVQNCQIIAFHFVFQRFHGWREDGGAEAGQGRYDQHLLCGLGASVREVPQVGVRDVTGQRKGIVVSAKNPWKRTFPLLPYTFDFRVFFFPVLLPPVFLLLLFSLRIMMLSVLKHTKTPVKFWFLKNYLSPTFKVGFYFILFYFLPLVLLWNSAGISSLMWKSSPMAAAFSLSNIDVKLKQKRAAGIGLLPDFSFKYSLVFMSKNNLCGRYCWLLKVLQFSG